MSLNFTQIATQLSALFDDRMKGFPFWDQVKEELSGFDRKEPVQSTESHPADAALIYFFSSSGQASLGATFHWNDRENIDLPRSFQVEEAKQQVQQVSKLIALLRSALKQNKYSRVLRQVSDDLHSLISLERGLSLNFWRSIEDRRITLAEINTLRSWFVGVSRLLKSIHSYSYLFSFIQFEEKNTQKIGQLQRAYREFFLPKASDQLPICPQYYRLARELIRPSVSLLQGKSHWQDSVPQHLPSEAKKELASSYQKMMREKEGPEAIQACLSVAQLGARAVFLEVKSELESPVFSVLPTPDQSRRLIESRVKVLQTYQHFMMLFAAHFPMKLDELDRGFQRDFTALFPVGHAIHHSLKEGFFSQSLRMEYVKFLLIQQIMITEGHAFKSRSNLDLAIKYLSQHRTWQGRLAHRIFGVQTDSSLMYQTYRQTLDKKISPQKKQELVESIGDQFRRKAGRFRKRFAALGCDQSVLLLEESFPRDVVATKNGLSVSKIIPNSANKAVILKYSEAVSV